ncbi:PREDICTED: hexamerin-like [Nicrophorus vespilloides]|uniref:Hexamerin-like n=1 Tax=Nicrophorus vespilloides TaxID=110193 RepID=A0ABM1MRG6_NICVS|nr:PREDICTED: hexamerin-like [Nicrophorus vespilloides]
MRTATVVLLAGVCALAVATPVSKQEYKIADKVFLEKEKDVLRLFEYVNQPAYYKDFIEIAKDFKFDGHWDQWTQPQYAKEFYHYYEHDILPQGEVFSVFYPEHLKQAVALFRVFYYAKDFETFFKSAVWARQHVNEGIFVYALSVAVIHSQWTNELVLPPIYEIYPQFFFTDEVIHKAQQYKQHYWGTYEHEKEIKDESYKGYTIQANYSGWYMNVHPEQSMTYFTEDVGLNSYYYYLNIFAPFWMESKELKYDASFRGQFFYYRHQQLLARYYLERLSNGKGEIPHFDFEHPIETGFYPSLTYGNGLKFPTRPNHANLYYHGVHGEQNYKWFGNYSNSYTYVKDYERRLRDALDNGWVYTPEGKQVFLYTKDGFQTLCNLVESNPDSPHGRFYGDIQVFARHLLGYSYFPLDQYKVAPSALEHFETSLRDPMFFQFYKRMMYYFHQYQNYMGPYERQYLNFDGVKVEDVQVDRLITFFDYYYSDLSHSVAVDEKEFVEDTFEVRARQFRLNHKPFNYKINVVSEKAKEAFVKVFIGPKYDEYGREIDMEDNYMNFFELDRFTYSLQAGKNVIERNSRESKFFSVDRTTYKQLYKQVLTAYNGGEAFKYYPMYKYTSFPQRLMLPKGEYGGKTYQFYVIVSESHGHEESSTTAQYLVDTKYTIGYPFDRPIKFEHDFFVPNSYVKDVVIYHKNTEEEMNTTWSKY